MTPEQHRHLTRSSTGRFLRELFANATNRTIGERSVSRLRAQLLDAEIDPEQHDAILEAYKELVTDARKSHTERGSPMALRAKADSLAVEWLGKIEAADDLFGEPSPALTPAERAEANVAAAEVVDQLDAEEQPNRELLADMAAQENARERQRTGYGA